MAFEKDVLTMPGLLAGVDLSGLNSGTTNGYQSTAQFLFAKLTADNTIGIAGIADCPYGVIQNNAKAGSGYSNIGASVRTIGLTKLMVGAADLAAGAFVGPDANGLAVARVLTGAGADAGRFWSGIVQEGASAGNLCTVFLFPPQKIQV